jgi:hypothetical protein
MRAIYRFLLAKSPKNPNFRPPKLVAQQALKRAAKGSVDHYATRRSRGGSGSTPCYNNHLPNRKFC